MLNAGGCGGVACDEYPVHVERKRRRGQKSCGEGRGQLRGYPGLGRGGRGTGGDQRSIELRLNVDY